MKKIIVLLIFGLVISMTSLTSCKRQASCPAYESATTIKQHSTKGEKKKKKKSHKPKKFKRGKTNLFPKKMRKN